MADLMTAVFSEETVSAVVVVIVVAAVVVVFAVVRGVAFVDFVVQAELAQERCLGLDGN